MALRYSFDRGAEADMIDQAISATLDRDLRTPDIMQDGKKKVGTVEMGDAILEELGKLAS
mgnify:FL=1